MDEPSWMRVSLLLESKNGKSKVELHSYSVPPKMADTMKAKFRGDFSESVEYMENLKRTSAKH